MASTVFKSLTDTTFDSVEGYRQAAEKADSPQLKQALTHRLQQREIPGAVAAEAEIVAEHQAFHAEAVDKNPLHEGGGRHGAQTLIETDAQQPVHAEGGQRLELLAEVHEPRRRLLRVQVLPRQGLEDDHHGRQPQGPRLAEHPAQHCLVAPVHTVEGADSGDAAAMAGLQVMQASPLHLVQAQTH